MCLRIVHRLLRRTVRDLRLIQVVLITDREARPEEPVHSDEAAVHREAADRTTEAAALRHRAAVDHTAALLLHVAVGRTAAQEEAEALVVHPEVPAQAAAALEAHAEADN